MASTSTQENETPQSIAPMAAQANVVAQSTAYTSAQENANVQSSAPTSIADQANVGESAEEAEDISSAPTEILSPEKMAALHKRIWQQDQEQEPQYSQPQATQAEMANGSTDSPTVSAESSGVQNQQGAAESPSISTSPSSSSVPEQQGQDITGMSTADVMPSHENETIPIPPPPPPQVSQSEAVPSPTEATQVASPSAQSPQQFEVTANSPAAEDAGVINQATTEEKSSTMQQPSSNQTDQPAQPSTSESSDFSPLSVGTRMLGRYEVTQVISESPQEHVYQVIDRQGYQHCWNCGSEQNAEGDEFCIDCGASLLNVPYIMHEYGPGGGPSTEGQSDAHVLSGNIVNTFVDSGRTYMIEQPQVAQNAFPNGVHLVAVGDSDAGDVRRSEPNEDSILILQLQRVHESLAVPTGVFIVADGLGGHDNGQVASRMTINIIAERMVRELLDAPLSSEKNGGQATLPDEDAVVAMFHGAIEDANTALVQMNQRDKTDMGSTITGFMIVGDHSYIINVGDSRTYMMRGKQIYQLTTDHSLVAQLVAGGLIEPDEVYTHPQRSQIFRSLGDKPNVQIDVFKQQLHPGDILLSCSDGLWEMVRNPQIESILNEAPDPQTACAQLIEAANANGGEDNVSAVLVYVK
jgi:serine/threonine protein phosphatase PrpC